MSFMNLRLLSKYLLQFHSLPLPDLGLMVLSKQPARLNILDKNIAPGFFLIEFRYDSTSPDHFIDWLSAELNATRQDVAANLIGYVSKIKDALNTAGSFRWGSLGVLEKDEAGRFVFNAGVIQPDGYSVIHAEKFIKKNTDHRVLVGDRIFSESDIKNLLTDKRSKVKGYWMALSLVVILMLLTGIGIIAINQKAFFFKHQHQLHIKSKPAPATYINLNSEE
jgi:hypothetical protein